MVRAPSFKKISFRTTKAEEAFLESLNQTSYHAVNTTEFMHKLLKYFMSAGTAASGLTGSLQASGGLDKNDINESEAILQEMLRLASLTNPLEVMNCIKHIAELEAMKKGKPNVSKARPSDPNQCCKGMVEQSKLIAEFLENCARIRRGFNGR